MDRTQGRPNEEEGQGFLFVRELPGAKRRALHVEVNSALEQLGGHRTTIVQPGR